LLHRQVGSWFVNVNRFGLRRSWTGYCVGRFVEIGPIAADYGQNAVDMAAKRAEHEATNTPIARELASLATTLVLDSASSHERGRLSALESGNLVPELVMLAGRTNRPEVKLLVAAELWNAARGKVIDAGAKGVADMADPIERDRAADAIDHVITLCTELEQTAPSIAARSSFVREVLVAARKVRPQPSGCAAFTDADGQPVARGQSVRLPTARFSVNVTRGDWRLRTCDGKEEFKPMGRDDYIFVSLVSHGRACEDVANEMARTNTRSARALEPFETEVVEQSHRFSGLCLRLRGGAVLLVTGNVDAPDNSGLATALGRAAIDEIGKYEEPPEPFNAKHELAVARPELSLLTLVGQGIDTGWGGTLGFHGIANSFDPYDESTAALGFAHGGRGSLGYESHNMVAFDGFYGLGFVVRVWHVALMITGGAGVDVLDGGHKKVLVGGVMKDVPSGFVVPFAFDLGFDARFRGWPTRRLGFEIGGGWLKRAPDDLAKYVTRDILLDGHVLVRVSEGFVMSGGIEYVNWEVAHEVKTVLGFGF
jgi:hypothetical protein